MKPIVDEENFKMKRKIEWMKMPGKDRENCDNYILVWDSGKSGAQVSHG